MFRKRPSVWRGLGAIKGSGLAIRAEFSKFDAEAKFAPKAGLSKENRNCLCGEVLKGLKRPPECKLFGKLCSPEHPVGACMVSSEGACAAYYRYG